jgi:hypothetical protein
MSGVLYVYVSLDNSTISSRDLFEFFAMKRQDLDSGDKRVTKNSWIQSGSGAMDSLAAFIDYYAFELCIFIFLQTSSEAEFEWPRILEEVEIMDPIRIRSSGFFDYIH